MTEYQKDLLSEGVVEGNINNYKQRYKIYYYPQTNTLKDKIAVYFLLENENKEYAKRSIYFSNPDQLMKFITELSNAYILFNELRTPKELMSEVLRKDYLYHFLEEINKSINEKWSEEFQLATNTSILKE
jgi:hypothetical protein